MVLKRGLQIELWTTEAQLKELLMHLDKKDQAVAQAKETFSL